MSGRTDRMFLSWVDEHWAQVSWFAGTITAIIAWFLRLESRVNRIETRAEMSMDAIKDFEEASKKDREKIHDRISDVHDKIIKVAEATSRIEGYCKARSGKGCGE